MLNSLLLKTPYFGSIDFRIVTSGSPINMIILDEKIVFMEIKAENALLEKPALYSNNSSITRTAMSYFLENWETAAAPLTEETLFHTRINIHTV
jgi:hypothetical protein